MGIVTLIVISIFCSIFSVLAYYYTFSKQVETFYDDTSEMIDEFGLFLIVGYLGKGLHKLYMRIFPKHHMFALRITTYLYGSAFLMIGVGVWFIVRK